MEQEVGLLSGLAQNFQSSERINDLYRNQQYSQQQKQLAEARAKMFADDVEFQNAMNSHDGPIASANAKQMTESIGAWMRNNPTWRTDPYLRAEYKSQVRAIKEQPDLIRGVASDGAYKSYLTDLKEVAKNPEQHDQNAYNQIAQEWDNYLKYGNQYGLEAAGKEGKRAFVYSKPQDFIDLAEKGNKLGTTFSAVKPVALKNGRSGAWTTEIDEKSLDKDAQAYYLQHKTQFDQQHPTDPIGAAKEFIKSGIKKDFNWGDTHLQDELFLMKQRHAMDLDSLKAKASAKGDKGSIDYYEETIFKPAKTADTPERLDATFGSKIKHLITSDDGAIKIDNTGDVFNYNGDIQDVNYRQDGKYTPNGVKTVSGYVYKPLEWGIDNGVLNDPFGPNLGRDPKVDGNWTQTASLVDVPGKDGESKKMLKIKVKADVDAKAPAYQGKYNSLVATTDQRNSTNFNPNAETGTYEGHKIGSIVPTSDGNYLVTKDGYVKQ